MEFNISDGISYSSNLHGFKEAPIMQMQGCCQTNNVTLNLDEHKNIVPAKREAISNPCGIAKLDKRVCSVCGEPSIGTHYGAPACSGCRSFFRRTVISGKKYTCVEGFGKCEIVGYQRQICKGCRFQKCLKMGMQMEELTKRAKFDTSEEHMTVDDSVVLRSSETMNIMNLVGSYSAAKDYALNIVEIPNVDEHTIENDLMKYLQSWHYAVQAQAIMLGSWIKRIPGYKDLNLADQVLLFRCGSQKHFILRNAFDTASSPEDYEKRQMNLLGKIKRPFYCPQLRGYARGKGILDPEYHTNMMINDFITPMKDAGITERELACFAALLYLDPTTKGLSNPGGVRKLRAELQSLMIVEKRFNPSLTAGVMDLYNLLPTLNILTANTERNIKRLGLFTDVEKVSRIMKDIFSLP